MHITTYYILLKRENTNFEIPLFSLWFCHSNSSSDIFSPWEKKLKQVLELLNH